MKKSKFERAEELVKEINSLDSEELEEFLHLMLIDTKILNLTYSILKSAFKRGLSFEDSLYCLSSELGD